MECMTCHKRCPEDGITLYRMNEFGVDGVWCCETCHPDFGQVDPEVVQLARIIEGKDEENKETGK